MNEIPKQTETNAAVPKNESTVKSEARKAIIGALIAIALNPFSLVLGFFLNSYLQSPKLSMQSVIAEPYWIASGVDSNVLKTITANRSLVANIRNEVQSAHLDSASVDWLEGKPLGAVSASELLTVLNRLLANASAASEILMENQRILEKWKAGEPLLLRPMPYLLPSLLRIEQTAREDKASAIAAIASAQQGADQDVKGLDALIPVITRMSKISGDQPRDGVNFKFGVLNSGSSDGVVYAKKAVLHFGDTQLPLKADKFTVVKAHSFEEVEFEIDEDNATANALDRWKSLVRSRAQESFRVEVTDDGKKKIPGEGRLEP